MTEHPYADSRAQIEDQVRGIVDPLPEHVVAVLYLYMRALGWSENRARIEKRKAFGD